VYLGTEGQPGEGRHGADKQLAMLVEMYGKENAIPCTLCSRNEGRVPFPVRGRHTSFIDISSSSEYSDDKRPRRPTQRGHPRVKRENSKDDKGESEDEGSEEETAAVLEPPSRSSKDKDVKMVEDKSVFEGFD